MKFAIRALALAAALTPPLAAFAQQQLWPNRVVRVISTVTWLRHFERPLINHTGLEAG